MPSPSQLDRRSLDAESRAWLDALGAHGEVREAAIARLHDLLLRAARFEVARRRSALPHVGAAELDDIALQSADDALVAVLAKLDRFRGQSRFTTWAYKFALLEAAVKMRRRPWQGRELPLAPERWPPLDDRRTSPHAEAEQAELLVAVREAMQRELTAHQRDVLVAVALNDVPIDVLAERLGSTRGAIYKTIHDARRKLRRALEAGGHATATATDAKEGPR
jgi:RNA polymerase sigma-70 factor, ECF subfamily